VREYSESTQEYIDEQLASIMASRYETVKKLLNEKHEMLEYIAQRLLVKEVIDQKEFESIIKAEVSLKTIEPSNENVDSKEKLEK